MLKSRRMNYFLHVYLLLYIINLAHNILYTAYFDVI